MMRLRLLLSSLACLALWSLAPLAHAGEALPASLQTQIDTLAHATLKSSGVPSASIAVLKGGQLVYAQAYGNARLAPDTPATTAMRYSIGSISKQFTAAAILILQQQGKLSLDDKLAKYFPDLTDAAHISIRQLLSHTSGYQDYWPQDYVMAAMLAPTTPAHIMDTWAKKPLDYAPGTDWQYSNTNYVIAGEIIRKLSGQTPFEFLHQQVFTPLGMTSVYDTNLKPLPTNDARGYHRYALGPLRAAPKEGVNWLYAMAELSMTPSDLAKWDAAMLGNQLLQAGSWQALETEVPLNNGLGSGYGLGVAVGRMDGQRMLSHGGEVSGFTATNMVFPDAGIAVAVLTNQDAVGASGALAGGIAKAMFSAHDASADQALAQAQTIFEGLQHGRIDRKLFSSDANAYFSKVALHDYQTSLGPLGKPVSFTVRGARKRGGMQMRAYVVAFAKQKFSVSTYTLAHGKIEQFIVASAD